MPLFRGALDCSLHLGDTGAELRCRSNLANALCKLRRWNDARQEILRALECQASFGHAAEPWKSWSILADIEAGAGNADLAVQANAAARDCYLAYRRDGGENHDADGRIALAVTMQLLAGEVAGATAHLDQLLAGPELPSWFRPFIVALRAIAASSRDRSLADASELHYTSASEILLLIDTLEAAAAGAA